MKRSKRYKEAEDWKIKVPHIEFDGVNWGMWSHPPVDLSKYQFLIREADNFCHELNKKNKKYD